MADDIKVIIDTVLKDTEFQKGIKGIVDGFKKSEKSATGFFANLKKNWSSISTGMNQTAELIKKVWNQISKAIELGREFDKYKQGMDALSKNTGQNADTIVKKLKEVSDATVSNRDLMLSANRAVALGVTNDVGKMADLMTIAREKAKAMGTDTTQAFNDIVTGIGRGSPLILDNLGIVTKGWDVLAKQQGRNVDTQFILDQILKDNAGLLKKQGDGVVTNAEKWAQFNVAVDNVKMQLGSFFSEMAKVWLPRLTKLVNGIGDLLTTMKNTAKENAEIDNSYKAHFIVLEKYGVTTKKQVDALADMTLANYRLQDAVKTGKGDIEALTKEVMKYGKALKGTAFNDMMEATTIYEQAINQIEAKTAELNAEHNKPLEFINPKNTEKAIAYNKALLEEYYAYVTDSELVKEAQEIEKQKRAYERLNEDLLNKQISQETYDRYIEELYNQQELNQDARNQRTLEKSKLTKDNLVLQEKAMWDQINSIQTAGVNYMADYFANGVADMILEGKSFADVWKGFVKQVIREVITLITKLLIVKALKLAFGIGFADGGEVPGMATGGKVIYAAGGFEPKGTDTVPAMLTPGERVLTVGQNKAFESMLRSLSMPQNGGNAGLTNNNTTNNNQQSINNVFNNNFEREGINEMLAFSQRTGTRLLRR